MRKLAWTFILSVFLISLLMWWGPARGPRPVPARKDQLIVALQSGGRSLDPHKANDAASMRLIENMYSTLVRYGRAYGDVAPDLADRWTVSPEGRTYTFHLRGGVRFHGSGREVTAEDVRYSVGRIREMRIRAGHFAPVESIRTEGPRTVVFELSQPFAPFLTYLANPMNAVVDRAVAERPGGLDSADGGSGPFRLERWVKGRYLILRRFAEYFEKGKPRLEAIEFRPIPDETARTTALRNAEVDMVLDVPLKDVARLERAKGIRVQSVPGSFWEYVGFNTTRPPFNDERVRQAAAWALDREVLNRIVKLGRATVLDGGHIPPGHWAHVERAVYPKRDVSEARRLLAAAGHPEGLRATLLVGSDFRYQVDAAIVVKQQLQDAGIDLRIQTHEPGLFFHELGERAFEMTLVGWVGFVDPDEWTYEIFHSEGKWNQQGYTNPRVDALLERGRATRGRAARRAIYREVQLILAREAPMVFLYANDQITAHLADVRGYRVHPTATTRSLADAWLDR